MTHEQPIQPVDERAALPELERLRDAIQAARQERLRKSEEFDRFVQSFRKPSPAAAVREESATAAGPMEVEPAPTSSNEELPPPIETRPDTVEVSTPEPGVPPVFNVDTTSPARPSSPRLSRGMWAALGVAAAAIVAFGFWIGSPKQPPASAAAPAVAVSQPAAERAQASPSPVPPPAAAPAGVTVQFRTVQAVWMRVTVDGQKKLESLVPAGQHLQFSGDRAIVIRAGNGGDVVVTTPTGEEPFGETGQPLTRAFLKSGKTGSPKP